MEAQKKSSVLSQQFNQTHLFLYKTKSLIIYTSSTLENVGQQGQESLQKWVFNKVLTQDECMVLIHFLKEKGNLVIVALNLD